ncbi:MAG: hypothetical protein HC836_37620 [Richelia sp. RM2_1_2]|nr:hypothetical protein [Richelia sp. SM2_1_7]NJN12423.1 hypothetical protein [Richelia sp. RM1_1_1]NJO30156.1 hypothetical protein [Richelia sp. SL_2_1]NJO63706.1 hypothetical protein [Richelia sp. RM2_1_2]NJS16086.1 hypothetical protein [Nostocaceae cyanobacterium CSU_2_110]
MTELLKLLNRFDITLTQIAPTIASRLQSGLTSAEIEAQIASFPWTLPQDAFFLYQWHNGLSGKPGKFNFASKLLRIKDKWHGELTGRENEVHLKLENRLIVAKFLPLEYSIAGHRHLKFGRCQIDLLPFSILTDGEKTIYCMMHLDPYKPIIYCANGTKLPPMKVTESFLSTQPQFSQLSDMIAFLTTVFSQGFNGQ